MRRTDQARRVATAILERPDELHYGYDLVKVTKLRSGVVYPILLRMANDGWLVCYQVVTGERRRYYRLTPLGLDALREYVKETQ